MGRSGPLSAFLVPVVLLAVFVIYQGRGLDVAGEYISLLPSLLIVSACIWGAKNSRGINQVVAFGLLGAGLALFVGELNTLAVFMPDFLADHPSLTLGYTQALLVVGSTIVGAAISRG